MIVKKDICYLKNAHKYSYLDYYRPDKEVKAVFIYFHGGGIEGGSRNDIIKPLHNNIDNGLAIVYPDYRLYPEAKFPQFIEDSASAVKWVIDNLSLFDGCDNIYIGGSSAGAYLSMMLYFDKQYLGKHNLSANNFKGFVFDAGQPTAHYNVLREKGIDTRRVIIDNTAPLYYVEQYDGQPPVMVVVAENDMANRLEQNLLLMSAMRTFEYPKENIVYKYMQNAGHCTYNQEQRFTDILLDFIKM